MAEIPYHWLFYERPVSLQAIGWTSRVCMGFKKQGADISVRDKQPLVNC